MYLGPSSRTLDTQSACDACILGKVRPDSSATAPEPIVVRDGAPILGLDYLNEPHPPERLWHAFLSTGDSLLHVKHPTREGAIAAFRTAWARAAEPVSPPTFDGEDMMPTEDPE